MRKFLSFTMMFILTLLLVPIQGQSTPTWFGTTTYDFISNGGSTQTMTWEVYKPTDTGSLSGSATDFTYQYTLTGWNGYYDTGAVLDILTPFIDSTVVPAATTGNGVNLSLGLSPAISTTPAAPGTAPFQLSLGGGSFVDPLTDSVTAWWTSKAAPVYTTSQLTASFTVGSPETVYSGAQLTMAPGVPEPETWALLLALMGLTACWLRRRQDDKPLQSSITA